MLTKLKRIITILVKAALLMIFIVGKLSHFRRPAAIHSRVLVPRDGLTRATITRVPSLVKPRYTRWWRALLLLGHYRLSSRPGPGSWPTRHHPPLTFPSPIVFCCAVLRYLLKTHSKKSPTLYKYPVTVRPTFG